MKRRGGVSAGVISEADAASYVKKVKNKMCIDLVHRLQLYSDFELPHVCNRPFQIPTEFKFIWQY